MSSPYAFLGDHGAADAVLPYTESSSDPPEYEATEDGRVDINVNSRLARTLSHLYPAEKGTASNIGSMNFPDETFNAQHRPNIKANVVIQIVGSRGDIQPFIALGQQLQHSGHRVRVATHGTFKTFVKESGLEFFSIGGDPHELMAYMVKNPGLIPSMKSVRAGEIEKKRAMVGEMLEGCWKSCILPDTETGQPFVADIIIANPPSFAHMHCAQALGVPVHIMFTMPWSSTTSFPHPLVNLKGGDVGEGMANYLSYNVVEWMTWQGLGDVINTWRKSIDLEEVGMFDGPQLATRLQIPHTYCWSPALVPKPSDWSDHIDICGFFFRDEPDYTPPTDLAAFLQAGNVPIYIGFGSIVAEDPARLSKTIIEAVQLAGVRAIISRGWSDLASDAHQNDNIYYIGDCPHEWLFQHVSAVVHHGGAGTTACGLKYGLPTTIVPFFGDQPFWGSMVNKAGAGPPPIHHKHLNSQNLAEAIRFCKTDAAVSAAKEIARTIRQEHGVQSAVNSFHSHLPTSAMQCSLLRDQPAVWQYSHKKKNLLLSKRAAQVLISENLINAKHLKWYESKPIYTDATRWDPVTGGASSVVSTATGVATSLTGMVTKPISEYKTSKQQTPTSSPGHEDISSIPCSSSSPAAPEGSTAGKMALASAKSVGNVVPAIVKGTLVDFPLALTEGLRTLPGYYNGNVRDHGPVTGAASGAKVAGKTLAYGFMDGLSDVVVQPYQGAKKDGALGAAKGVGKGLANLTTKTGAGIFGLLAYNAQGIHKSLHASLHDKTRRTIASARLEEGEWLVQNTQVDKSTVIRRFLASEKS